jgi:rod shape-determining protein MreC
VLDFDGTRRARRRDAAIAGGVALAALILFLLPAAYQRPIQHAVQNSALRPFLLAQATIANKRSSSVDVNDLRAQRDSFAALIAAEATLSEENSRLRSLLGLHARGGAAFIPAEVLKLGVAGAESTFMINIGSNQGVVVGAPVLAPEGLIGVVADVQENTAQAMDWTHPDFRASAMTADGMAYGIVEPRRGRYREEDLLALTGAPFHTDLQPGTLVVTSGRGQVYPRGIPLGVILGIEDADTGWRKSYLIRPAVRPEAVVHVLIGLKTRDNADLSKLWNTSLPPATVMPDTVKSGARPIKTDTAKPAPPPETPAAPAPAPVTTTTGDA